MKPLCHEPALLIVKIESTVLIRFRFVLTLLIFAANVVRAGVSDGASDGAPTEPPTEPPAEPPAETGDKRPDPKN